jgi:HEAT repeat protein
MTNRKRNTMAAVTILAVLAAADVTTNTVAPLGPWGGGQLSAQEPDDEESTFLRARSLINRGEFVVAAREFALIREKYPQGKYLGDSFYWEAFARHRMGQLEQARQLLDEMLGMAARDELGNTDVLRSRVVDARQLRLRILGQLAESGDSRAAEYVLQLSDLTLGQVWDSTAAAIEIAMDSLEAVMGPAMDSVEATMGRVARGLEPLRTMGAVELLEDLGDGFRFSYSFGRRQELPEGCEDDSMQQEALTALLRLVETDRVQILRGVIDREDECSVNLRVRAVELLAREDTQEAEREVIDVAMTHSVPRARYAAVSGLRRFDSPTAIAALATILMRSKHQEAVEAAISALRRSERAEARQALTRYAANAGNPEELREDAIVALARRSDVSVVALVQLYATLDTEDLKTTVIDRVRRKVADGHGQNGETWLFNLAFDASESKEIRSSALDAWARSPSLELSGLADAFGRLEDPELRERIFYGLYRRAGQEEGEAKSEVVRKMVELARLETDGDVRERAVYWLGRTGSPEAVEFLLELLRGPERG